MTNPRVLIFQRISEYLTKTSIDVEIFRQTSRSQWLEDDYLSQLTANTVIQQGDVLRS